MRMSTSVFLTRSILVAVKMAVLPASQCWPTDRSGMCKFGMQWHSVAAGGRARSRNPFEVACIVDLFAVVICKPWGVGASLRRGVVLSQRFIVQPVSTTMNLGGTTEVLLGRVERAHQEGGMGGK